MAKKIHAHPDEGTGLLVQCPFCHVARGMICMVPERLGHDGRMLPARPASAMHIGRIAMGQKWKYWHKGLEPRT